MNINCVFNQQEVLIYETSVGAFHIGHPFLTVLIL